MRKIFLFILFFLAHCGGGVNLSEPLVETCIHFSGNNPSAITVTNGCSACRVIKFGLHATGHDPQILSLTLAKDASTTISHISTDGKGEVVRMETCDATAVQSHGPTDCVRLENLPGNPPALMNYCNHCVRIEFLNSDSTISTYDVQGETITYPSSLGSVMSQQSC